MLCQFLSLPLVLMTLTLVRNTGQIFDKMPPSWDLSNVLLMIIWVYGKMITQLKCYSFKHISGVYYHHNFSLYLLSLITLGEVIFVNFLPFLCCFFESHYTVFEGHYAQPTFIKVEAMFYLLEVSRLHVLHMGNLSILSHLFIMCD